MTAPAFDRNVVQSAADLKIPLLDRLRFAALTPVLQLQRAPLPDQPLSNQSQRLELSDISTELCSVDRSMCPAWSSSLSG